MGYVSFDSRRLNLRAVDVGRLLKELYYEIYRNSNNGIIGEKRGET